MILWEVSMDELLIQLLKTKFNYPVKLQGSLAPDAPYPDNFFTFWNDASESDSYYDDKENAIVWEYSLNFYSNDPDKVNTVLLEAKELLITNGFTASGAGYSVLSDELTHTGRGISVIYRQKQ